MIEISQTTFVDFVVSSGNPRITCVRKAKETYGVKYHPAIDYWKKLRDSIIEMHENNSGKNSLNSIFTGLNSKKFDGYSRAVKGYQKWMGKKKLEWVGIKPSYWNAGDLTVRVNPELCLRINGVEHLIKLYFKSPPPTKNRLDTMLHLIDSTRAKKHTGGIPAILDVQRGKIITPTKAVLNIDALLNGEAAAFLTMWDRT